MVYIKNYDLTTHCTRRNKLNAVVRHKTEIFFKKNIYKNIVTSFMFSKPFMFISKLCISKLIK